MLAELKFERKLNENGEPKYILVRWVNTLEKDDLPGKYLRVAPFFYTDRHNDVLTLAVMGESTIKIHRDTEFDYDTYSQLITNLKRAGERLTKINRRLKKLTKNWKDGEFVVTI